ncbi:gamma-glutamyltransferase family protein [Saliphagus infecundisoli]|uniref:Gamma-glutamyltransferase family protein n=1 Tax=Saliphagus infecundisoli TaxID=1849069 RepID=A0ABD5QAK3_9EURY|nr:gamma-glutamyltransferase [Saliphagus infecundisoli]
MSDTAREESGGDESEKSVSREPDRRRFMRGTAVALGLSGAGVSGSAAAEGDEKDDGEDGSEGWEVESVSDPEGVVSASHPIAAEVGAEVLESGGNAFDAAAAVQLALTVVDPYGSGLGGSGMLVGYSASEDGPVTLNCQARAPIDASVGMRYDDEGNLKPPAQRSYGGISIGTPGTLRGLDVMLKRWGTRSLGDLATRPREIAAEGFELDERVASVLSAVVWRMNDAALEIWAPDGEPLEAGDLVVQEDLAGTLSLIEEGGIDPFYRGEIGEAIVDLVQDAGGVMEMADLRSYRPTIDPPTRVTYEDSHPTIGKAVDVLSTPPPVEGGLVVPGMLKIIEGMELPDDPLSATRYHRTWAARATIENPMISTTGDPEFVDVPVRGILSDDLIASRRDLIDPDERNPDLLGAESDPWARQPGEPWTTDPPVGVDDGDVPGEFEPPTTEDTTHFSVADGEGNVVSFTGTLSSGFGTGAVVPGYGFFLNNSIAQLGETGPDRLGPLRRYNTTAAPTLVLRDGEPFLTCGSPGGIVISQVVADVLVNVLEYGMSLEEAVAHPRMYVFTGEYEAAVPEDTIDGLESMGYTMADEPTGPLGDTQMVAVDRDGPMGVYDPRRGGGVVGASGEDVGRPPRGPPADVPGRGPPGLGEEDDHPGGPPGEGGDHPGNGNDPPGHGGDRPGRGNGGPP